MANDGTVPLEIMIEIMPDRYVLQPGEKMEIEAVLSGGHFHVSPYDGGLQIFPGHAPEYVARINGVVAKSWT